MEETSESESSSSSSESESEMDSLNLFQAAYDSQDENLEE